MFEVWESRAREFQRRKWTVVTVRSDDHVMIEGRYPTEAAADRRAAGLNRRKVLKRAA